MARTSDTGVHWNPPRLGGMADPLSVRVLCLGLCGWSALRPLLALCLDLYYLLPCSCRQACGLASGHPHHSTCPPPAGPMARVLTGPPTKTHSGLANRTSSGCGRVPGLLRGSTPVHQGALLSLALDVALATAYTLVGTLVQPLCLTGGVKHTPLLAPPRALTLSPQKMFLVGSPVIIQTPSCLYSGNVGTPLGPVSL